jgi:hypothetical protein
VAASLCIEHTGHDLEGRHASQPISVNVLPQGLVTKWRRGWVAERVNVVYREALGADPAPCYCANCKARWAMLADA